MRPEVLNYTTASLQDQNRVRREDVQKYRTGLTVTQADQSVFHLSGQYFITAAGAPVSMLHLLCSVPQCNHWQP